MFATVGKDLVFRFRVGPILLALNPVTLGTAGGLLLIIVGLALWIRRGIPKDPEDTPPRRVVLLLTFLEFVENQVLGGMAKGLRRSLLPLIATLFIYVLSCNLSSILPIPGMAAPTQDLNVTLGLALLVYLLTHIYGIRTKGGLRHVKSYLEPIPVMLPMNLIGDMGRTISHGFRLFGNILGGAIMLAVTFPILVDLSLRFRWILGILLILLGLGMAAVFRRWGNRRAFHMAAGVATGVAILLVAHVWLPLLWATPLVLVLGTVAGFVLNGFFGVFAGVIQALVFTLLAASYIIQVAAE
ncbi:MAG: FoF1 ATP synthase subunit A [Candidatus Bipolaricaulaceae bacterium]